MDVEFFIGFLFLFDLCLDNPKYQVGYREGSVRAATVVTHGIVYEMFQL